MKRFLFLFAIVLVTGTMLAAEKTDTYVFNSKDWTATLNAVDSSWTAGKSGSSFVNNGVTVTTTVTGANATSPIQYVDVKKIVVTYNTNTKAGAGSFDVVIGDNDTINQSCGYSGKASGASANFTTEFNYDTPQSGYVNLKVNCTTNSIYVVKIAITYLYTPSEPEISAEKIELGTHLITLVESGYAKDTTLAVEGVNLGQPIGVAFIGTHLSATESELPASGGTLHLHVATAAAVELADTVVLTSGETVAKVPVVAKIKQQIALPGTSATMTAGTKATAATVDGIAGFKVGTSDADGNLTITVPANTTKLRFYAVANSGAAGTISLSAPAGVTFSATELTLLADAGITGNPPYVLNAIAPTPFKQEITLAGVTAETEITVASGTARRFVIWDPKYDEGEAPEEGYMVNYLSKNASILESEVVSLNLPEAPVIEGFSFLYWKVLEGNISTGINIQAVYESNTPTDAPAVVVNPANKSQKLIREGNVYILHDGKQYNLRGARL